MYEYTFRVETTGYGDTPEQAWEDACENIISEFDQFSDPTDLPDYECNDDMEDEDDDAESDRDSEKAINDSWTMKNRKINLHVKGMAEVPVQGRLVIEVPVDITGDEIENLRVDVVKRLAKYYASQWEDGKGIVKDAESVRPTGECEHVGDVEADVKPDCRLVRGADGKLRIRKVVP